MQIINSTNIVNITYLSNGNLIIEFRGGSVYEYKNVPVALYEEFIKSDSKGKFFYAKIKNKFETFRL